MELTMDRARPM